jgi:hypothetical protein
MPAAPRDPAEDFAAASDPLDPDAPHCDVCAATGRELVRFDLTVRGRFSGAIELCAHCWATCSRKHESTRQLQVVA